jgi:hypothetical protein
MAMCSMTASQNTRRNDSFSHNLPCDGLKRSSFFVRQFANFAWKSFWALAVNRGVEDTRRQVRTGHIRMPLVVFVKRSILVFLDGLFPRQTDWHDFGVDLFG